MKLLTDCWKHCRRLDFVLPSVGNYVFSSVFSAPVIELLGRKTQTFARLLIADVFPEWERGHDTEPSTASMLWLLAQGCAPAKAVFFCCAPYLFPMPLVKGGIRISCIEVKENSSGAKEFMVFAPAPCCAWSLNPDYCDGFTVAGYCEHAGSQPCLLLAAMFKQLQY